MNHPPEPDRRHRPAVTGAARDVLVRELRAAVAARRPDTHHAPAAGPLPKEDTMTATSTATATAAAAAAPGPTDEGRVEEFAGRLFELYTGGMLTFMVDLGHRTGLFDAAAAGPATSSELAARAGLEERYVREWLGALVTAGIVDHDAAAGTYELPAERAACLTGEGNANLARFSQLTTYLARHVEALAGVFRHGGGVPYEEFRPHFTDVMDALSRSSFDDLLLTQQLPRAPGLVERLTAGARLADVGCGTGHALVLLAQAFPRSTFVGCDLAADAIERARQEAEAAGVDNAHFEVRDAAGLARGEPFDAVVVFDTVHDLVDPAGVLRAAHDALVPGGTFLMSEPMVSSRLEDNVGHPLAPWLYSVSTLHCLTVSLAEGGAGLGTAFGEQRARALLDEAGFVDVSAHDVPGDPIDKLFVCRRPATT